MKRTLDFNAPTLVFGGVYSNSQALDALIAFAHARNIPRERWICTGDVIAYCADARLCLERVRDSGALIIAGNCEESLGAQAQDCGCGFAPGSSCDALSASWYAHAASQMDADLRSYLAALPPRLDVTINGLKLAIMHGAPDETSRFVFASAPDRVLLHDIAASGCDGVLAGHSGLPFTRIADGKLWHNSGALGMPANDGTPRIWCSVLTPGDAPRTLQIEHVALDYEYAGAASAMGKAGLPEDYARALETGLWPSCDVLPKDELKAAGRPLVAGALQWRADETHSIQWPERPAPQPLVESKFKDPQRTASGDKRASVALDALHTLWINTGTLCNLACVNCYIESSPRNDRLAYFTAADAQLYYDEIERDNLPTREIGFTGGEPFMNPEFMTMLEEALARGFHVIVLTNAMKPMQHHGPALSALNKRYDERLTIRVSVDHYTQALHELERGPRSWAPTMDGLRWLASGGFRVHLAGRLYSGEVESVVRAGYAKLTAELGLSLNAYSAAKLTLFPEMDARADIPEITESCWGILHKSPSDVMCASSRMVVRRKGAEAPAVLACTLLAYDEAFELGRSLQEATRPVALNHPHCARFCVLGGASCS
jgi:uncharacterized radical SAM superfamily Fe-S cluster-containing enzyme